MDATYLCQLIAVGLIIGLLLSLDRKETIPKNKPRAVAVIKKDAIGSTIPTEKFEDCTKYCGADGFCQSPQFYTCNAKQDDINFGRPGRQRTAFIFNTQVLSDTMDF